MIEGQRTVSVALDLHPEARRVVLVSGSSPLDRTVEGFILKLVEARAPGMETLSLGGLALDEQLRRLAGLPGRQRGDLRLLPSRLPGPVRGGSRRPRPRDPSLGRAGVRILGDLPGPRDRGRRRGTARGRRGAGRPPHRSHPPGRGRVVHPARSRNRPGSSCSTGGSSGAGAIAEERLPEGSAVLFREKTLWSEHRGKVLGGIAVLLAQALLIGTLLVERRNRLAAQAGLEAAERRYRTVADFTHDWEYWRRPDGSFAYVSPSCHRTTGHEAAEFERRPALLDEIVLEEDRAAWKEHDEEAQGRRSPSRLEFRIRAAEGQVRWMDHVCSPVTGEDGTYLGVRGSNRDVTEKKRVGGAAAQGPGRDRAAARAARGRQHLPARTGGAGAGLREHHRRQRRPALRPLPRPAGGAHVEHGPPPGRDGRREGARRPRPPQPEPPPGPPPRQAQLRGAAALPRRERALRAREGRFHRGGRPAQGPLRGRRRRPPSSSTRSASCPSSCRPSSCG